MPKFFLEVLEYLNSFFEGTFLNQDNQIDVVEIFATGETSSQVGSWVSSRIEFIANRAYEPEESFSMLVWYFEVMFNE